METRTVLLIFLLELEISEKIVTFMRNCIVKMTLRLFEPLSVVMTMVPKLLRQFGRSLQIKKCIANAPRMI